MAQEAHITVNCDELECRSSMVIGMGPNGQPAPTPEQQLQLQNWLDVLGSLVQGKKNYCSALCALRDIQRLFDESVVEAKKKAKQAVEDKPDLAKLQALAGNKEKAN